MKTVVEIEWDEPQLQEWLCADNISIALHAYCKNTKFKVTNLDNKEPKCPYCGLPKNDRSAGCSNFEWHSYDLLKVK